jgi:hypothetical protein
MYIVNVIIYMWGKCSSFPNLSTHIKTRVKTRWKLRVGKCIKTKHTVYIQHVINCMF